MGFLPAFIYGVLQGLTEFLPVSSSAHLALLPSFLSIQDPGIVFDLSMHVGTALAVIAYFRKELKEHTLSLGRIIVKKDIAEGPFVANMILTTFFSIVSILILQQTVLMDYGRNPSLIAFNLAFFGCLMGLVDYTRVADSSISFKKHFTIKHSFLIGCCQALSIFPGVSRSGITLTICRLLKFSRTEATNSSFLLSLPLIIGGFCYKILDIEDEPLNFYWGELLFGTGISFIVGFLCIHYFLKIMKLTGLWSFALYRILLAIVIVFIV